MGCFEDALRLGCGAAPARSPSPKRACQKCESLNPKPYYSKPYTLHPKPYTLHPKP